MKRNRHRRALALGAAAALILGACSGGEGDESTTITTTPPGNVSELATWCSAMQNVDNNIAALSSGQGDPGATAAAIDAAEQTAPAEMQEALSHLTAYGRQIVSDAAAAESDAPTSAPQQSAPLIPPAEYFTASVEAGTFMAKNCEFEQVEVTATDYEFDGLDGEIAAGTTLLQFTNDGAEYHEIDIERLADGEERSVGDLLQLMQTSPDEAAALVTPVALTFAPPNGGSYAIFDLQPGRYLAMCHVPVGATPEALQNGEQLNEDDSHLLRGMIAEFSVS